ncbi:MAG: hypothetical protein AAFX87_23690 [Bacteroidota bacterium]
MKIKHVILAVIALGALITCFSGCHSPALAPKQPNIANGGRAVAVTSHPSDDNIIVVASETGGLFRSTNGGDNWRQVSGASTFRFRDVMFLPTNSSIVLAAANSDTRVVSGGGIYRSDDGGVTWGKATMNAPTTSCTNNMAAHSLSFDASNGRLWTGTDCGLFFSDDQGSTWNFLSGTSGLGSSSIRAVLTPSANKMAVLTNNTVRVSTNGGANWNIKQARLPGNRAAGQHNQIAISAINDDHIYFAFNFWELNSSGDWERRIGLYYTQDFGDLWSVVRKKNGWNRPPFVTLSTSSLGSGSNKMDLYFGDGGCELRRREVTHGAIHGFGVWQDLSIDHCDPADLGISQDGKTPILLASDGGVHKTTDNGASWTMAGGGSKGYNALQITEVTGQRTTDDNSPDLYFGTQDNDNWASANYGSTWPNRRCCEGFYLNVPQKNLPAAQTTHTGVSCAGCGNYRSGPALSSQAGWNNPPRTNGNPALIKPGNYVQKQFNSDSSAWQLARSTNTGSSWTSVTSLSENSMNLPLVVGPESNPIIYLAIDKPGETNGEPNIGLKRISGFLTPTIVQSDLSGFGNIGTFPTMFAWYEVFGVNPKNPNHIIVPDIANGLVKKTNNGGLTWSNDNNLKDMVTNSGEFKFLWGRFTQISSFGWDPDCAGHIMVGTVQAGVFETFNNGATWQKVEGSEKIPFVSSFFFSKEGEVVISSYGRGLWRYKFECPPPLVIERPDYQLADPLLWYRGDLIRVKELVIDSLCQTCGFYMMRNGNINDIEVDEETGEVKLIYISGGELEGFDQNGQKVQLPVQVTTGSGGNGILSQDKELREVLKSDRTVKGVYLQGNRYSGVIVHTDEVQPQDLPDRKPVLPQLRLNIASGDLGIPIDQAKELLIIGSGFDPSAPVEIIIDGNQTKFGDNIRFNDRGEFRVSIPPTFGIGSHKILIRQSTDKGVLEDSIDIRFVVSDYPDNQRD